MYRKMFYFVFVLVLSFACTSYADDIIIGDFEGSMEGWVPTWETPAPTFSYSTTGATLGASSLAIQPNKNGWQWSFMHDGIVDIKTYNILSADVTWVAAEWGTTPWCNFKEVAVDSNGTSGWKQYTPKDPCNPDWPGSWDPVNWGDQTRTLTWDLSGYDATGATWMHIVFSSNFGGDTPGKYYIDNVRLIAGEPAPQPEPGTEPGQPTTNTSVIGDFEGTLDGWTGAWAGTDDLGNSTIGATLNGQSMSVKVGPGDFWKLQRDGQLDLVGATAIEADVTFVASEWPDPNTWLNVHKIAIQDHTAWAWQEVDLPAMTVTKISGADAPGLDKDGNVAYWKPEMGDTTWTVSWSLEGKTLTNDVYSLFMSLQNTNIAKSSAGLIYIDNVRVVVPPATTTVVVADFEGTLEGWTGAWAGTDDLGNSTIGATLNGQSLSVKVGPGDFWKLQRDGQLNLADALALEADVTFVASEWPDPNSWLNVNKIAIQDHTSWAWQEVGLPAMTVTKVSGAEPPAPDADGNIAWWKPELGDATWTVSWSLAGKTLTNDVYSLFMSLQNTNIAKSSAGLVYVDNVRLVVLAAPPPPPPPPKKIIWVSDSHQTVPGATVPDDQGWVDLLKAAGYDVDQRPSISAGVGPWQDLDADEIADLEAADLIIVSRDSATAGHSSNAAEVTQWNSFKTPLILASCYMARSNRWLWFNSTSIGARQSYFDAQAIDPIDPLFAGVQIDAQGQFVMYDENAYPVHLSFMNTTDAGNGRIIATRPDNGNPLIVVWEPNVPFYATSTQTPGGKRMFFNSGTQETSDNIGFGVYNLTAEGQKVFLNGVRSMLGIEAAEIPIVNFSFEEPNSKQNAWDGGTNAKGTFVDVPGWNSDTIATDSGIEGPDAWPGHTDGVMTGFLMGTDPSAWNLLDYTIVAGDDFILFVDARDNWTETASMPAKLQMTLYCLVGGVRTPLATTTVELTTTWNTFSLTLSPSDAAVAIGSNIGIELTNATASANSWIGMDNVHLINLAGRQ
ncbi:MAG: hypothetical protein MUP16_08890 [Sedimentisphaerales bacterium]|nr:hypothetical protein [Sedimentisphaerales bacterium]